ncbi:MAG TPA: hypothetical protein VFZ48_05360 [Candidatus Saccharimonadales bacterium]
MVHPLHTAQLIKLLRDSGIKAKPATKVLQHDREWRIAVVGARYTDAQNTGHFLPYFAAVSQLLPAEWIAGLDRVDRRIRNGDSLGQTLVDEAFGWAQNRLHLGHMGVQEIPSWVHSEIPNADNSQPWRTEMYDIFARNDQGEFGRYARVLELCPANLELPYRDALGSLQVWRAFLRYKHAVSLLFTDSTATAFDDWVSQLARTVHQPSVQRSLKILRHKATEWRS